MIHGAIPLVKRINVLNDFRSDGGTNILLMTLGTGAAGWVSLRPMLKPFDGSLTAYRLNLASASRIYLLEPQWNPSIESQAIGRALRLGQRAQVCIVRYVMMYTVEEV
jgi:SWI/SNF-related matrix-associated actin-dependent regulator of chromatin subfamily A3